MKRSLSVPLDITEEVLGVDPRESGGYWHRRIEEACTADRLNELAHRLHKHYADEQAAEYPPGTLVPHVYHSLYHSPPPDDFVQPPWGPALWALNHALIFAHGVEVVDPLPAAVQWTRSAMKDVSVLLSALQFWREFQPLIEAKVITCIAEPKGLVQHLPFDELGEKDQEFRRELNEFLWEDNSTRGMLEAGGVKRSADSFYDLIDILNIAFVGPAADIADDLVRALHVKRVSQASVWLPNAQHFKLLSIFLRYGLSLTIGGPDRQRVTKLLTLDIPGLAQLTPSMIVAIRRDSEVFEEWRQEVAAALAILDSLPEDLPKSVEMDQLKDHMAGAAARIRTKLPKENKASLTGALRAFGIGSFAGLLGAGAAGGVTGGRALAGSAAAGVASAAGRAVGDVAVDFRGRRRRARALAAAGDHAMILSPSEHRQ